MDVLSPTTLAHVGFRDDVLAGLLRPIRRLPGKYAFDRRGSLLFEALCTQPQHYQARAERQLIERHGRELAAEIGRGAAFADLSSGTGVASWPLLKHLERSAACVLVDPFPERLRSKADVLRRDFTGLRIDSVCADFSVPFRLPSTLHARRRIVYLPGAAIGRFEPACAVVLLHRLARLVGKQGGLLVGIDLVKDPALAEASYNDRAGVAKEFNLNLLLRINRDLGGEFDLDEFEHSAFYDRRFERMDIRLVSKIDQEVVVNGIPFAVHIQEPIQTHYAHNYSLDRFARVASEAGLAVRRSWTDDRGFCALVYLTSQV